MSLFQNPNLLSDEPFSKPKVLFQVSLFRNRRCFFSCKPVAIYSTGLSILHIFIKMHIYSTKGASCHCVKRSFKNFSKNTPYFTSIFRKRYAYLLPSAGWAEIILLNSLTKRRSLTRCSYYLHR